MTEDSNLTVEQRVERKSPYVAPEIFDYGDADSLTKTTNSGLGNDGGTPPTYINS
jgi:hypothetical protein